MFFWLLFIFLNGVAAAQQRWWQKLSAKKYEGSMQCPCGSFILLHKAARKFCKAPACCCCTLRKELRIRIFAVTAAAPQLWICSVRELGLTTILLYTYTPQKKKKRLSGSTEIWTRIAGFRVQSANHYTMEPIRKIDDYSCYIANFYFHPASKLFFHF